MDYKLDLTPTTARLDRFEIGELVFQLTKDGKRLTRSEDLLIKPKVTNYAILERKTLEDGTLIYIGTVIDSEEKEIEIINRTNSTSRIEILNKIIVKMKSPKYQAYYSYNDSI